MDHGSQHKSRLASVALARELLCLSRAGSMLNIQGCGVGAGVGVGRSRGNEPGVGVGVGADQTASTPTPERFV